MTIEQVTEFFKWLSIINVAIFIVGLVMYMLLRKIMCSSHSKIFGLDEKHISLITYCWFGAYKIGIIFFCITPYVAMKLIAV